MNTWMSALQCLGFGVMCVGVGRHLGMDFLHGFMIFVPLAFIFGCWLAREESKVGL